MKTEPKLITILNAARTMSAWSTFGVVGCKREIGLGPVDNGILSAYFSLIFMILIIASCDWTDSNVEFNTIIKKYEKVIYLGIAPQTEQQKQWIDDILRLKALDNNIIFVGSNFHPNNQDVLYVSNTNRTYSADSFVLLYKAGKLNEFIHINSSTFESAVFRLAYLIKKEIADNQFDQPLIIRGDYLPVFALPSDSYHTLIIIDSPSLLRTMLSESYELIIDTVISTRHSVEILLTDHFMRSDVEQ